MSFIEEKHSAEHADTIADPSGVKHGLGDQLLAAAAVDGVAVATDAHGHGLLAIDPKAEARLRRKIDFCILPLVCLLYLWTFLDRINIGNARLYGLEKDLKLAGQDYNIILMAYFIAYVIFELPANILCKIIGPGRWLPTITIVFGVLTILTSVVHNFGGMFAVRFFLGAAECGILPGIAYALSRWYTKKELAFRYSIYISMAPLSGIVGGLLASDNYGIVNDISHIGWLTSWRMLFLIEGIITTACGFLALALLADRPETARWLNLAEKELAIARLKAENVAATTVLEHTSRKTVMQGVLNINAHLGGILMCANAVIVQGISVLLPTIVRAIYPTATAVVQNARSVPPYAVGLVFTLALPYLSYRTRKHGIWVLLLQPFTFIGFALFLWGPSSGAKYTGAFFVGAGSFPTPSLVYAWVASNTGPDAARAASTGIVGLWMNIGGLISAWTFLSTDGPRYVPGNIADMALAVFIAVLTVVKMLYIRNENKLRDSGKRDHRLDGLSEHEVSKMGHLHPEYRYTL